MKCLVAGLFAVAVLLSGMSSAEAEESRARYTFSWPLDGSDPTPRGGTTKGPPVTLDTAESPQWRSLRAEGLASFERDRRAILAMAGNYRVTFDFLEVATYTTPEQRQAQAQHRDTDQRQALDQRHAPYQSWGTEKIYVDRDDGRFISLVHILEMRVVQKDGSIGGPMVTKHWRQDWTYEPAHVVEYRGNNRWERRSLPADVSRAGWSQTVYQVDESPRYASAGRWQHSDSFSTWLSGETWRPLPRREWSVRDDYQILIGTNRHTVTATGWLQEENNLKAVLAVDSREASSIRAYLGREYGVARYERIRDADFAAADRYYGRTRPFWNDVRASWAELFARQDSVTLKGPVDKLGLFHPLFEHAAAIERKDEHSAGEHQRVIREAFDRMVVATTSN
ncbi:MAG: DUF6607 family protein [Gammaproteobacteria bacterium]